MGDLRTRVASLSQRHRVKRRYLILVCLMGLLVAVMTSALMRLPAFTQQKPTFCGMEEHHHTDACGGPACDLPEHVHDLSCYSDPEADVETEADWLRSLPPQEEGSASERLVSIAQSQLGYSESDHNYEVRDDGSVVGYTRYGAWEGMPYEDWNVAFAAFCLQNAGIGIDEVPRAAAADAWIDALARANMYEDRATSSYYPLEGDMVFLSGGDGRAMVGIVEKTDEDEGEFAAIVGDWGDAVSELSFDVRDGALLGFGRLPDELRPKSPGDPAPDDKPVSDAARPKSSDEAASDDSVPDDKFAPDRNANDDPQHERSPDLANGDSSPHANPWGLSSDAGDGDATRLPAADAARDVDVPRSLTSSEATPVTLATDVRDMHIEVEAMLSAGATYRLVATPVPATSEQIAQVEKSQEEELGEGIRRRARVGDDLLLLDLSILDNQDNEVEPQADARVVVTQAAVPDAVVHFGDDGAERLEAHKDEDGFSFAAEGFSVFAFAFTVDFAYEGYEYRLPGGAEIEVTDLMDKLGVHVTSTEIRDVAFSDPSLVDVSHTGEEWVLKSRAPFSTRETLTVSLTNGDTYSIQVTDAKPYRFFFNVSDAAVGNVYVNSRTYDPELEAGVQDDGVSQYLVKPRSADDPFNAHLTAARGYHFVGWRTDGYVDYGMGAQDVSYSDLYSIRPSIAEDLVGERDQTFTACFAPDGQYLITFDKYVRADEQGRVNGYVVQADAKSYSYVVADGTSRDVHFCYSGSQGGAYAIPNDDSVFVGWYEAGTNNLVCEGQWFVPPEGLDRNITVQAYFAKAAQYQVHYYSYNTSAGGGAGNVQITGTGTTGTYVTEWVYDTHNPSGAVAYDLAGFSFVAWRDENNRILTRDHELEGLPAVSGDVSYKAEYLPTYDERILISVKDPGAGKVYKEGSDVTDLWVGAWGYVRNGDYITLSNSVVAVPNEGYRFDHWEFNGQELYTHSNSVIFIDKPTTSSHIQDLVAVFVPVYTITYDTGAIQYVGVNAPDYQHWEDVPWCSKNVQMESPVTLSILGEDLYSQQVDHGATFVLPSLAHNTSDGNETIRVSQTDNGYNLLTHTFKGWRIKNGDGTIYPEGTTVTASDSVTFEAVWDAYLPGKAQYHGTGLGAHRYNTNTCSFYVRLFDSTFDINNTGTYTDCLFTSRIELSGEGAFATDEGTNGKRMDFYGNSQENVRATIDKIDSELRSMGNTGIPYSTYYSNQNNGDEYNGSIITFEHPFPSDEFMFARLRAWNAAASENRKIQVNGTVIPQEHLTSDYFDLRWYVLKDQENSWHVDGMLIPKYAKLVVTKRFEGAEVAINLIKSGGFYIGVTRDQAKTENTSLNEEYKLRLHWHTNSDSNDDLGYYIDSNGTYTWVIDTLEPLTSYWVAEHYYTPQIYTQDAYATSRSIRVSNTLQSVVDVGDSNVVGIEKVYSYPGSATIADIQTVSFTNRYTRPREIALVKQDAVNRGAIANTRLTFTLYVEQDGRTIELPKLETTDSSGMIVLPFPNPIWYEGVPYDIPNGTYRFKIEEEQRQGYRALPGVIAGTVELSDTEVSHVTLDTSVTSNPSLSKLVELGQITDSDRRPLLHILNEPETTNIQVTKTWTNGTTTPVTMLLLRDGVSVTDKSVQLSSANNWTASWEGLPAYVNGNAVTYTVREEWIGEPGGEESVHYNASVDATDGFEDYVVSQSQSQTATGDVSVYVQNTPNSGQIVFSKVDDSHRAVSGAEFTVYTDSSCRIPITAAAFVSDPGKQRPSVFVSSAEGMVTIEGLNPGTYYLRETLVPSGYVLRDTRTYTLTVGSKTSSITYINNAGAEVGMTQVVNPVYTRKVSVRKVATGTSNVLQGAVFSLHGELPQGGMDPAPMVGHERHVSGADGSFSLGDLKQGTYYLVEESAPVGYNKLESPVRLTVPADDATAMTAIKVESNTTLPVEGGTVTVPNSEGVMLPSTGGDGAGRLQSMGVVLALFAATLSAGRRRARRGGGCA